MRDHVNRSSNHSTHSQGSTISAIDDEITRGRNSFNPQRRDYHRTPVEIHEGDWVCVKADAGMYLAEARDWSARVGKVRRVTGQPLATDVEVSFDCRNQREWRGELVWLPVYLLEVFEPFSLFNPQKNQQKVVLRGFDDSHNCKHLEYKEVYVVGHSVDDQGLIGWYDVEYLDLQNHQQAVQIESRYVWDNAMLDREYYLREKRGLTRAFDVVQRVQRLEERMLRRNDSSQSSLPSPKPNEGIVKELVRDKLLDRERDYVYSSIKDPSINVRPLTEGYLLQWRGLWLTVSIPRNRPHGHKPPKIYAGVIKEKRVGIRCPSLRDKNGTNLEENSYLHCVFTTNIEGTNHTEGTIIDYDPMQEIESTLFNADIIHLGLRWLAAYVRYMSSESTSSVSIRDCIKDSSFSRALSMPVQPRPHSDSSRQFPHSAPTFRSPTFRRQVSASR